MSIKTLHRADNTTRSIHLGGWRKQTTDVRDEAYRLKLHGAFLAIPTTCDNRPVCSPIEDQGDLGSCTANMFAGLVESNEIKRGAPASVLHSAVAAAVGASVVVSSATVLANGNITFTTTVTPPAAPAPTPPAPPAPTPPAPPAPTPPAPPAPTPPAPPAPVPAKLVRASRLFEYYGTRKIEGTTSEDSGATIRDAIKCGVTYGVADESVWPYDVSKFKTNPATAIWTAAATHKVTSYHSIADGDLQTMKSTLASGSLVGFGFQVYDYFMSSAMAAKGLVGTPGASEQLQGGHAVCLVGYDDTMAMPDGTKGAFLVRNSWGTGWGWQGSGYFWMSYAYVGNTNLCSDFWVVVSAPL